MSASKEFIPTQLLPIYEFLQSKLRVDDVDFLLRVIKNKEAGLGMRAYELDRLQEFEKDWFDSLPMDFILTNHETGATFTKASLFENQDPNAALQADEKD